MSKQRIGIALLAISLLSIFWIAPAQAQGGGWPEPYRLSSEAGRVGELSASCVVDQYGYVHCFWAEILFENQKTIMQYARFDGATWSAPNDIYMTSRAIENISSVVDQDGILHIVWVETVTGGNGSVYYTYAPASNALRVQDWAQPLQIDIPAGIVRLRIDSKGVFHILYVNRTEEELGVYYVRSEDQGITWSEPIWLDPDILPAHTPDSLNFELDENDGLHAVWFYGALDQSARPDWVRYIHSLDGGHTWSAPVLLDQYNEAMNHRLTSAGPIMTVQGQTVHVIWAGGSLPYRNHSFSTDAGRTWSLPVRIFGELHGQAGDSLVIDGAGRVHFFGQIRYPYGIYHAYWDQTRWSEPELVYWIARADEDFGDRIHAHRLQAAVWAGNQLVLTFGDPPTDSERRLFVVQRRLDDILPLEIIPTPTPNATLTPPPNPTLTMPELTPTAALINTAGVQSLEEVPKADLAFQFGLVPVLLILGATIIIQLLYKRKR